MTIHGKTCGECKFYKGGSCYRMPPTIFLVGTRERKVQGATGQKQVEPVFTGVRLPVKKETEACGEFLPRLTDA